MAVCITKTLRSLAHTEALGRALGEALGRAAAGEAVILLSGELGSGKTTLAKAICAGLGIDPRIVISPTYTLVNIYPGPRPVYHVDLFRIEDSAALLEMDRNDWINAAGPTLIEWPGVARPLLEDEPLLEIELSAPDGGETREVVLRSAVPAHAAILRALPA
ncbi:MAG: tRNA (adenosine(37)-N6)-threonylcarbamoyltransferase complex ATPase subunit type 1 TsaE [Candidatus Lambdaproteobacteria bacterium]|nr:tRNA (adenosine(37)-N6)-threonylcarbamoyltransferase complex ATPase subunit type 1 TsaE [Candidatus Lambdaproteobacteria bacterium]